MRVYAHVQAARHHQYHEVKFRNWSRPMKAEKALGRYVALPHYARSNPVVEREERTRGTRHFIAYGNVARPLVGRRNIHA